MGEGAPLLWHRSQIFLFLLIAFLGGVFLGSFLSSRFAHAALYALASLAVALVTIGWRQPRWWLVAGLALAGLCGLWRYQAFQPDLGNTQISYFNEHSTIVWEGAVVEEPDVRSDKVNLTVRARRLISPQEREISGNVLVTLARYPEYHYGDVLQISGKLETPFENEEFSYKNYLAKSRIYTTVRFPRVMQTATGQGNTIKAALLAFKGEFTRRLALIVAEPQNSLLAGLLVGVRRGIPADLADAFKTTGVSHIVAISGFNISIITRILGLFLQRRFGPRLTIILSVLVVMGFVVITGAAASVVRAAIMGMLVVLALNIGRVGAMSNLLFLTAALMVLVNPQLLVFDVGFQLSFLATAGLLFCADEFERICARVPNFFQLRAALAATLAAQLFVLPLLVWYFDRVSLVSPLVNVLVVPVIPWAMFFGFLAGALALIAVPLGYPSAWIAWAFLTYQIAIVEWFSKVPFAALATHPVSAGWVASYYAALALAVFVFSVRRREEKVRAFLQPPSRTAAPVFSPLISSQS